MNVKNMADWDQERYGTCMYTNERCVLFYYIGVRNFIFSDDVSM